MVYIYFVEKYSAIKNKQKNEPNDIRSKLLKIDFVLLYTHPHTYI